MSHISESSIKEEALQRQANYVSKFLSVVSINFDGPVNGVAGSELVARQSLLRTTLMIDAQGAEAGNPLLPILLAALGVPGGGVTVYRTFEGIAARS